MVRYLLKRLFYFICTCFAVALVAFLVTVASPGDPVDRLTSYAQGGQEAFQPVRESEKARLRHRLGLDLPVFYVSLHSAAEPDTLYRIFPAADRNNLERLLDIYGSWPAVSEWYHSILSFQHHLEGAGFTGAGRKDGIRERVARLREVIVRSVISMILSDLSAITQHDSLLKGMTQVVRRMQESFNHLSTFHPGWKSYVPLLHFHGQNQFHRWLFGGGAVVGLHRSYFDFDYFCHHVDSPHDAN